MKPVRESVDNWLKLAEYDLAAAEAMLRSDRMLYVVFCCQQAVEKAFKALIARRLDEHPPRTHDLLLLARETNTDAAERFADLLTYLNQSALVVRYPLDLDEAVKSFPRASVEPLVPKVKEVIEWARSSLASAT